MQIINKIQNYYDESVSNNIITRDVKKIDFLLECWVALKKEKREEKN